MSSGGKGGKSAKAPDYSALANQQAQLNMQAAEQQTAANRPNQYDAFGNSITWNRTVNQSDLARAQKEFDDYYGSQEAYQGGAGVQEKIDQLRANLNKAAEGTGWEQHQNLSPEIKAIWDKYISDSGSAMGQYGDKLNSFLSGYSTDSAKAYNDPEFNGKEVSDALYGSIMDRGRVEQQRETDQLNTQLRQQGLVPGSEAYNRAMRNLMTSQNDANLLAAQNATLAGGAEGRAKYGAYLSGRNQPIQELAGIAGIAGGQPYSPTYAGFSGATGYQPADLIGAAQAQYTTNQNSANARNSKSSGLLGAGASLGGSFLGSK